MFQMAPGGAMIDHALARAMQGLDVLLHDRLLRNEWNVRFACGGADRPSVVAVAQRASHIVD
jgi:hypothetical protein